MKEKIKSLSMLPKYKAMSSWWEHVPIGHWLIEKIQPERVVELGTHYGVSFFCFCEAAEQYSPNTFVYAVDTWEGDEQAGQYGEEVFKRVNEYQQKNHKTRSRLIQSSFDEAVTHFGKKSLDVIHIDGLHTYEAVEHDYNTWKGMLKENGTLIFHDCNVREGDFGVWKLWEEIKLSDEYWCIELKNGHGLGIATKGINRPEWHEELIECLDELKAKGSLLSELDRQQQKLDSQNHEIAELKNQIDRLDKHIDRLDNHNAEQSKIIRHLSQNKIARLIKKVIRIISKYLS